MAKTAEDLLEEWLESGKQLLAARKGSAREEQLEQRIAELEKRFEAKPESEQADAWEELTDEEERIAREAVARHRAGASTPEPEQEQQEETVEEKTRRRFRQGRKRGGAYDFDETGAKLDHIYVYSGDDEPDRVELEAEAETEEAA